MSSNTKMNIERISAADAKTRAGEALLLDVRTPAEHEEAHIPGAVLMPLHLLDAEKAAALAREKRGCIVVCSSGTRANQAAEKLAASVPGDLYVLDGGVRAWEESGLELNRGRKTMSLERQVRISAGAMVLAGVLLGAFVNPAWLALSGFVGAGLIFAGITDCCAMGLMLARMPWNNRGAACCQSR